MKSVSQKMGGLSDDEDEGEGGSGGGAAATSAAFGDIGARELDQTRARRRRKWGKAGAKPKATGGLKPMTVDVEDDLSLKVSLTF